MTPQVSRDPAIEHVLGLAERALDPPKRRSAVEQPSRAVRGVRWGAAKLSPRGPVEPPRGRLESPRRP